MAEADNTAAPQTSTALTVVEEMQNQVGKSIVNIGDSVATLGNDLNDAIKTHSGVDILEQLRSLAIKSQQGITRVADTLNEMLMLDKNAERRDRERLAEQNKETTAVVPNIKEVDADMPNEVEKQMSGFLAGLGTGMLTRLKGLFAPLLKFFGKTGPLMRFAAPLLMFAKKFGKFGPLGLVILGITALIRYGDELAEALSPAIDSIKRMLVTLQPVFDAIMEVVDVVVKSGLAVIGTGIKLAFGLLESTLNTFLSALDFINSLIIGLVTGDFDLIKDAFNKIKTEFGEIGDKLIKLFIDSITGLVDKLGEIFGIDNLTGKLADAFNSGVEWLKNLGLAIYNPTTRELFGFALPTMPTLDDLKVWLSDLGKMVYDPETRELFGFALPEIPSLEDIKLWVADMAKSIYDPETRQLFGFTLPEIPSLEDITLWLADLGKSIWDGETRSLFGYQLPEIPSLEDIATWVSDLGKSIYDPETGAIFGFTLPEMPSIEGMLDKITELAKSIYDPDTGAIFGFDIMGGFQNIKDKLADLGQLMKALSLAGLEAVKAAGPFGESPGEAFARKFEEVMNGAGETTGVIPAEVDVPNVDKQINLISPDDEMNQPVQIINNVNNNQQSNNQKTEVMAGNMDITIDPYTDRQLTSFGSVYP